MKGNYSEILKGLNVNRIKNNLLRPTRLKNYKCKINDETENILMSKINLILMVELKIHATKQLKLNLNSILFMHPILIQHQNVFW